MNLIKVVFVVVLISLLSFSSSGQDWEKAVKETKLMFQIYESCQNEYDAHVLNMRKIRTEFESEISEVHQADVQLMLRKYEERLGYFDTLRIVRKDAVRNEEFNELENKIRRHFTKLNRDRTYKGLDMMMPLMAGDREFKNAAKRLHEAYGKKAAELSWSLHTSMKELATCMEDAKRLLLKEKKHKESKETTYYGFNRSANPPRKVLLTLPSLNTTASFFVIEPF